MAEKDDAVKPVDTKAIEAALNAAVARGVKLAQDEQRIRDEAAARQQAALQNQSKAEREAAEKRAAAAKEDETLDEMPRAQFANVLYKRIVEALTGHVDNAVSTIEANLQKKLEQVDRLTVKDEIKQASEMPFFNKLREQTGEVLKERPDLSVTDAYHIAAGRNTELVAKLQTEHAEAEKAKAPPLKFGGLLPTTNAGPTERGKDMSPKDAADAAWAEASKGLDMNAMFSSSAVN